MHPMNALHVLILSMLLSASMLGQRALAQNVGIGTASPTQRLHVVGGVRIEDGTQQAGYFLQSDANGNASWAPLPVAQTIERATVDNTGTAMVGTPSVTKVGTGVFEVSFSSAFATTPTVVVTALQQTAAGGCATTPCGIAPVQSSYCTPSYANSCFSSFEYRLDNFSTTGGSLNITDLNTGCSAGNYRQTAQIVEVLPGGSFNFSASVSSMNSFDINGQAMEIYIDFNQDGDYNDPGEEVYTSAGPAFNHSGSITVPCSAICGTTRMRVRSENDDNTFDACSAERLGETHDYDVRIIDPTAAAAGFCTVQNITTTGFDVNCFDASGTPAEMGFTYIAAE